MSTTDNIPDALKTMTSAGDGACVTLGEIIDAFGRQSYGAAVAVPALVALGPTGAIPGMSIFTGGLLAIVGAQMLLGQKTPWLPRCLRDVSIRRQRLETLQERGAPFAKWLNRFFSPRLSALTTGPALAGAGAIIIVMALTMFPLALLPFAVAGPSFAILLIGLGLLVSDGLVVLAGTVTSAAILLFAGSQLL